MSESTPFKVDFDIEQSSSQESICENGKSVKPASRLHLTSISLLVSIVGNVVMAVFCAVVLFNRQMSLQEAEGVQGFTSPHGPPLNVEETVMPVTFGWAYYAATVDEMDEVDRNWDNLNPDVGVVSLPHGDFAKWNVIPGRDDPSDPSKAIHTLQAYHSLHCLKMIRTTMLELVEGKDLTVEFGHAMHCLGGLLRDVVCYADDSLPLQNDDQNGPYQYVRKCRNWDSMRKWASERTSCLVTDKHGIVDLQQPDFDNCSRTDGVLVPSLLKQTG